MRLIDQPAAAQAAGTGPKEILEFVGRRATGSGEVSVALMRSPGGWTEPGQTPEFTEISLVLSGVLRVETRDEVVDVGAGQAVVAAPDEWVRYSTPGASQYVAVCVPAFGPDTVNRDPDPEPPVRESPRRSVTAAIRPAVDGDFPAWLTLLRSVAEEGTWIGTEAPVEDADARARFTRLVSDGGGFLLVAERDGELAGSLGAHWSPGGSMSVGMFVATGARGRGIGTALMTECVDRARDEGAHKLFLEVWPHNEAARRLYRRCGFVEEGRLRRHYRRRNGELWDSVMMGLLLEGGGDVAG